MRICGKSFAVVFERFSWKQRQHIALQVLIFRFTIVAHTESAGDFA
ncbi:hypothetical protein THPR109532_19325 [Thalassospira profundimaris]